MKTKKLIECARFCYSTQTGCKNCPLYLDLDHCPKLYMMLVNRLEELHEKSKAKNVDDMMPLANSNRYVGFCPKCGEGVNSTMHFCSECGQKLKWGVTK